MPTPASKTGSSRSGGKCSRTSARSSLNIARTNRDPPSNKRRHRRPSFSPVNRASRFTKEIPVENALKNKNIPKSTANEYKYGTNPNVYEERDRVEADESPEDMKKHNQILIRFGDEMYEAFSAVDNYTEQV